MTRTIAVFGGTFSPPGLHHRRIVEELRRQFDSVVVVPCGPRPDKLIEVDAIHRAAMADLTFGDLDRVEVDLFDLECAKFTRTDGLDQRFAQRGEVWHVVGSDLVEGGRDGGSFIQRDWHRGPELWQRLNFAVVARPGHEVGADDLPPRSRVIEVVGAGRGSSVDLRENLFRGETVAGLMAAGALDYVRRHGLYRGGATGRAVRCSLTDPRLLIFHADHNPQARDWAAAFKQYECRDNPNCVLVIGGDGTMLRAIQRHWRLRVPFFGINAGHLGFLLNKPEEVIHHTFPPPEMVSRPMPLLYVEMQAPDGKWVDGLTFNDAWVERSSGQTAWLEVTIDGRQRLPKLLADGLLLSTAAGSTAYARSMGATPLLADTPAWLVVGSNVMQPLNWKSALLSLDSRVEVRNLDPAKRPLNGFVYGNPVGEVVAMKARVSRIAAVELAFSPSHDITEKINQSQFLGVTFF